MSYTALGNFNQKRQWDFPCISHTEYACSRKNRWKACGWYINTLGKFFSNKFFFSNKYPYYIANISNLLIYLPHK